jgi:peptidoglycan-associated lipoprotein
MLRIFLLLTLLFFSTSCRRNSSQTWEDVKTAGRNMQRGVESMWGGEYDSRMISSRDEFVGPGEEEFIPLNDADLRAIALRGDESFPQPKATPGEGGVPHLRNFSKSSLFSAVHFVTDEHVLRERTDIQMVQSIVAYLKKNSKAYLLIEGHTDERAPAGYNMALGVRRANHVRALLIKNGIDPNRVYTVSHGKEQPLALGHTPDDWKVNRRAEFKIFEK